jgi:hypothetical protein
LQREALDVAPKAYLKRFRYRPSSSSSSSSQEEPAEPETPVESPSRDRKLSISSIASVKSAFSNLLKPTSPKMTFSPADDREPEVDFTCVFMLMDALTIG